MDIDDIKNFADLALMIFFNQCHGSFKCGIGSGNFASQSLFLELNDTEIKEVLDYCIDENLFRKVVDKGKETFWLTLHGQIRIQQILERIGNIKMIYYIKDQNITLSDRLLLFLCEKGSENIGIIKVNFHNYSDQELQSSIKTLINSELLESSNKVPIMGHDDNYKDIYSFFGFKNVNITLKGKRKAYMMLKDQKFSSLWKLPILEDEKRFEIIDQILNSLRRFHLGANWLEKHRRKNHDPFIINNEYDVQDLLYSFLLINFPDADIEDPGKKIAGVSSRSDIVIQNLKLIIEIKCFKEGDDWTSMLKDINHKIQTYSQKENYDQIIIFIYNPDFALKNPDKIEKDLTKEQSIDGKKFQVIAIINPK